MKESVAEGGEPSHLWRECSRDDHDERLADLCATNVRSNSPGASAFHLVVRENVWGSARGCPSASNAMRAHHSFVA
jgi:hypothetical protein